MLKRKRDGSVTLKEVHPSMRVPIDSLMDHLKNDPTLQNFLNADGWRRLDALHGARAR